MNDDADRKDAVAQRAWIRRTLERLADAVRSGLQNGAFKDHAKAVACTQGKTRHDVSVSGGACCRGCSVSGVCLLSNAQRRIVERLNAAVDALGDRPAEMPAVRPEDFPDYDPAKPVDRSPRWIARQLYRFAVGYWAFADHDSHDEEIRWCRAFDGLLCTALGADGVLLHRFVTEGEPLSGDEARRWVDDNPDVDAFFGRVADSQDDEVNGEGDVRQLVLQAVLLRMEYRFGRDYPPGDMDVYGGAFERLAARCLRVAGIQDVAAPEGGGTREEREMAWSRAYAERNELIYAFMREDEA